MRVLLRTSVPLLLAAIIACAGATGTSGDGDSAPARLVVENRSSLDMDIEAIRRGDRSVRIGFVPAGETATFRLPPGLLAGASTVIFEARPARRSGRPVRSDPIVLKAGEEITWSIPPQ